MRCLYVITTFMLLVSCKTPSELFDEGNYSKAFRKAAKEIKAGVNIKTNTDIIYKVSERKVAEAIRYATIKSNAKDVKDWIRTQTKIYDLLKDIGEINTLLNGAINAPYDALCNEKKDVDYQIVEYYYDEGHDHLDDFYITGEKETARNAYYSFLNCEKYEGQDFFPFLEDDKQDAYQNGIVYYVSDHGNIGSKLFLKPLPRDAEFEPDCEIRVDQSAVSYSVSESEQRVKHQKEIETGQESVVDTSGKTTYVPIMEDVEATVITRTITVTAHATTHIWSRGITGQCTVSSTSYDNDISDTYDEVYVEGDERALRHHINTKSGEPAFFRSDLEDDLLAQAERDIGI